jgi:hypothetical protein
MKLSAIMHATISNKYLLKSYSGLFFAHDRFFNQSLIIRKGLLFILILLCPYIVWAQSVKYEYDNAGNRIRRMVGTDLTPRLTITPSITHGVTSMEITIAAVETGNAPTDGSEITVLCDKMNDFKNPVWDPSVTSTSDGTSIQNSIWTFSEDPYYYIFKTSAVIPKGSLRRLLLRVTLDPGNFGGQVAINAVIQPGSGGEQNVSNNLDSDPITIFAR